MSFHLRPLEFSQKEHVTKVLDETRHLFIEQTRFEFSPDYDPIAGGFGTVRVARLDQGPMVAVKELKLIGSNLDRARYVCRFARELNIWAPLDHPNVLQLLGYYLSEDLIQAQLISHFQPKGDVKQFLRDLDPNQDSTRVRHSLCADATAGLLYLHEQSICHGDLKPGNILVTSDDRAVLCDFGLAKVVDEFGSSGGMTTSKTTKFSMRYCAPELLDGSQVSHTFASDIWALGCLVYEILAGLPPYTAAVNDANLILWIVRGTVPAVLPAEILHRGVNNLLLSTWAFEPSQRPSAMSCLQSMRSAQQELFGNPESIEPVEPTSQPHLTLSIQKKRLRNNLIDDDSQFPVKRGRTSGSGHAGCRGSSPSFTFGPSLAVPPPFRRGPFGNDSFGGPIPGPSTRMSIPQSQPSGHPSPPVTFNTSSRHNLPGSPQRSDVSKINAGSLDIAALRGEESDTDEESTVPNKAPHSFVLPPQSFTPPQTESSFGEIYHFDRNFQDAELEPVVSTALINVQDAPDTPPLDESTLAALLSAIGVGTVAEASNAFTAQTGLPIGVPFSALVGMSKPGPAMGLTQNWIPKFGNIQLSPNHMELLRLWRTDVCEVQYTIAQSTDAGLVDGIYDLAISSEPALYGALLLASLYKIRLRGLQNLVPVPDAELTEVQAFKDKVATALDDKKRTPGLINSGDAMAGLFMVSAVLFEGGTATMWNEYLQFAKMWMENHPVTQTGSWTSSSAQSSSSMSLTSPGDNYGLVVIDHKSAFILKTTAWFDVLGSITMRRAPHFLATYRQLFGRQGGANMERIMGCNERVLLAIAETADLAKWKSEMEARGCLSNPELCARSTVIQRSLEFVGPAYDGSSHSSGGEIMGCASLNASQSSDDDQGLHTIRLVSNIFRATGKLYLHTVLSNCNPNVREIKDAVKETVEAFKWLPPSDVDKSLVFPVTLTGCMTDEPEYRQYLVERLKAVGKRGEAVGNTKSCLMLMQEVWRRRDKAGGPRIIDWIDTMKAMGWDLLLV